MTVPLDTARVGEQVGQRLAGAHWVAEKTALWVDKESLLSAAGFLKTAPGLEMDYLNSLTAVDRMDCFEVVYHLTSLKYNHSLVLKIRCEGRDSPTVPSVVSLWRSADLQEREVYDLFGIVFTGHPNLKRILLWEGYPGHPLRRDYL